MKRNVLIVAGLVASGVVMAETPLEVDSLIHLNSLVVSANKIEVNRNSVPLTISVIGRSQIENSSESALLPVLSEQVPGLFVTEKGITGFGVSTNAAGTINIRGVGSGNKVLVLFDGQPQWAGLFGHALPDTYVASDVEKVEVIRGPGSLLYGSNAMGGVINIITRRHHQQGRRTQARVMYGSYNTQKYMVNNGYNVGNFSSFVSINHDRTDGHRPNSDFQITNGFANLGYRFNDVYQLRGDVSLAKYKFQNPGETFNPIFDNKMDIWRGTSSLALENQYEKMSGAIRLFYNWGNHEINDGYYTGEDPQNYLFRSTDRNLGVLFYESFRFQSLETPLERQIRVESHNLPVFLPKIPELPYWCNHIFRCHFRQFLPFQLLSPTQSTLSDNRAHAHGLPSLPSLPLPEMSAPLLRPGGMTLFSHLYCRYHHPAHQNRRVPLHLCDRNPQSPRHFQFQGFHTAFLHENGRFQSRHPPLEMHGQPASYLLSSHFHGYR